jgi:hypothetical protein
MQHGHDLVVRQSAMDGCRPLPACPAGEAVWAAGTKAPKELFLFFDPCRLVRQVKQFSG